jgi:hypothetical protein
MYKHRPPTILRERKKRKKKEKKNVKGIDRTLSGVARNERA